MKKGILSFLSVTVGIVVGGIGINYLRNKQNQASLEKINKFKGYYNILNTWMTLKNEGKQVSSYFVENGYKSIAIYGMGEMGNRLYEELKESNIEIKYAVDKTAYFTYPELEIMDVEDELPKVDAIIVTATFAFEVIEDKLKDKVDFPIISLEDVIFQL